MKIFSDMLIIMQLVEDLLVLYLVTKQVCSYAFILGTFWQLKESFLLMQFKMLPIQFSTSEPKVLLVLQTTQVFEC